MTSKMAYGFIFCMTLLLWALPVTAAEQKWTFDGEDEGIATYLYADADTGLTTCKSNGFVDARMEALIAVLRDVPRYAQWMDKCEASIELKHIDWNAKVLYLVLAMPVFQKKRDVVIETVPQYLLEEGAVEIQFSPSDKASIPINDSAVRVNNFSGSFRLEFFGRNKTRVIYTCTAPPDLASAKHTLNTLKGLRRVVQQGRYMEEGLASPERQFVDQMIGSPAKVARMLKSRAGAYFTGEALLDTILSEKKMAAYVHAEDCSYKSIKNSIAGIFYECLTNPTVKVYLKEKPLDAFLDVKKLRQEHWLGREVFTREKQLAAAFFENSNNVFFKAMQSEKAVNAVMSDPVLVRTILDDKSMQQRLINDTALKKEVLAALPEMEDLEDLEKIIQERVEQLAE